MKTETIHANGQTFACLQQPGALEAALVALRADMARPIAVPTLALCGAQDLRAELTTDQARYFSGRYAYQEVAGATVNKRMRSPSR